MPDRKPEPFEHTAKLEVQTGKLEKRPQLQEVSISCDAVDVDVCVEPWVVAVWVEQLKGVKMKLLHVGIYNSSDVDRIDPVAFLSYPLQKIIQK